MKVGVLTSSRADYGIYLSLLKRLKSDSYFNLEIIAFGTHLSKFHGYTLTQIREDGYDKIHEISSLITNDDESSISTAFGLTILKFADFWSANKYDIVFCLGDRFEMAAAVQAGIPFGLTFAHLHGGETTLGAIDNIYRHQISLASNIHFPATKQFADRIAQIIEDPTQIYPVGSLSIDELHEMPIPSEESFREAYDIRGDFALLTFHPETVSPELNTIHAEFIFDALNKISQKVMLVVTMPNADTCGTVFRTALGRLKEVAGNRVFLIENFGKLNYFAAMRYCKLLIGNTSSGIIEAASFGKFVINVGNRQKGRAQSGNVIDIPFSSDRLTDALDKILINGNYLGENVYHIPGTVNSIVEKLKELNIHEKL